VKSFTSGNGEAVMVVTETRTADVVVVGAGPGGSSAAYHLARHGLSVLLLEKTEFPREKVCGDGLTPRAVRQLVKMGVDTSPEKGWLHNKGLRIIGGGVRLELDWPDLASYPGYGLTRTRLDFDQLLAENARDAGAELLTGHNVAGPILDDAGRVVGVRATVAGESREFRAPIVLAADGVSARFALALGVAKREDRPIGVAVRRYYHSPVRHDDDYLESWLELRSREGGDKLLPGYGWIFGLGDGRVNVGLGVLNSSSAWGKTNFRRMLTDWLATTPPEWTMYDEEFAAGPTLGAALPMGFNRVPHYGRGVLLVGDSGGMVNPFNGEGIAYAIETGEIAAELVHEALITDRPAVTMQYPRVLEDTYGAYFMVGRWFASVIGKPAIMGRATNALLPRRGIMSFALRAMANLSDGRDGDLQDRMLDLALRLAKAA
jgi:menaquinone-9 beta-reductase